MAGAPAKECDSRRFANSRIFVTSFLIPNLYFQHVRKGTRNAYAEEKDVSLLMVLRIELSRREGFKIFQLSGVIDEGYIAELDELFGPAADYRYVVADLNDIQIVDRAAVHFLLRCELQGLKIENCPPYVREWMAREAGNVEPREG
jgi:hypothetical protein